MSRGLKASAGPGAAADALHGHAAQPSPGWANDLAMHHKGAVTGWSATSPATSQSGSRIVDTDLNRQIPLDESRPPRVYE